MPDALDAPAVRTWCRLALAALGQAREEIDALNVYPVPDGDTGTNLYLTVESATQEVDRLLTAATPNPADPTGPQAALRAMAHGALIGARGNSGVILSQLLRGMASVYAGASADPADPVALAPTRTPATDGHLLRSALREAAASAYQAVAAPVEGTMLTVAAAAADAAASLPPGAPVTTVAETAHAAARAALVRTPAQLDALHRAGVVDAGGRGLVAVLGALADAVGGNSPLGPLALAADRPAPAPPAALAPTPAAAPAAAAAPGYEVLFLLDAPDAQVPPLRSRLAELGESLVVVGGDGLWNVHVHADDPGAVVEAALTAGRPHRIRITHFASAFAPDHADHPAHQAAHTPDSAPAEPPTTAVPAAAVRRGVVSVVQGEGLAGLCRDGGASVLAADPDRPPTSAELVQAVRRTRAREVVLLPNDPELRAAAGAAAEQLRRDGIRLAVIPTRSPIQGLAALAVHEPGHRFDEDVVAMTSAAGATRYAELAVAEGESWTMAGVCQAGDVLGLIDGDVAVIGQDAAATATTLLDRMLAAGGELLTLVLGDDTAPDLADRLVAHVRRTNPVVDTVVYQGGRHSAPLLIGVE